MIRATTVLLVIVAVAFFTLIERKVLGYIHLRKGPNKPGPAGIIVPFADAVKLFVKERLIPSLSNITLYNMVCVLILFTPILLWFTAPTRCFSYDISIIVIIILAVARVGVYGTLGAGWRSNRKYSMYGAIRAVAQTISYEVSMTVIVLGSVLYFHYDLRCEKGINSVAWAAPLALMMFVTVLAEANRSPFDFAEGESELVSGFNTEYASVLFVIIFLAEYISILYMSLLCRIVYLRASSADLLPFTVLVAIGYVWARGSLPRFRYDQLIYLTWKALLPVGLMAMVVGVSLSQEFRPWKASSPIPRICRMVMFCLGSLAICLTVLGGMVCTFKTLADSEKMSPFECGFNPVGSSRLPFCMKFFLIGILFLVFDVEVRLLLPVIYSSVQVLSLVIILTVGTIYEWRQGGLDWLV